MKKSIYFISILLLLGNAMAQSPEAVMLGSMKPRNIGPSGMSGRVTSIDVVRNRPQSIVIGTASGGVWRSDDGGLEWQPLFDRQTVGSIGAVAIQQNNPSVIWAGTGEGNPRNSHNSGNGIYKSIDGGRNWTRMGLELTRTIHRIIIHRDNPDIIYVAALGSAWGNSEERGVYKTTDGGKTWTRILFTNNSSGCAELIADPSNPDKLFASMWDFRRQPWTFRSGGPGSGLYVTLDGGKTWTKRTDKDGLPKGELGRIGLAISRSKPNIVYAIVESKNLEFFRSTDGGYNWQKMSSSETMGNRPFYYNEIYCDPQNENRIYSLWSQVSKSEDGGRSWQVLMSWNDVHPDHHAFYIHPDQPEFLINGNDGGLNFSYDGGKTWRFVENLPIGQFYHVDIDNDIPYNIYGGLQDNGSWRGPAYVWKSGGLRNSYWQELYFGDGFDVAPYPGDGTKGYAMAQGGELAFYNLNTHETFGIKPVHPEGKKLRFNWNAGLALDPFNPDGLYYGSQFVHYSADRGASWNIISPDLTTNDTSKQHQEKSGGLTIDATNAENHCTILAIAPSKLEKGLIWVATDDGNLQITRDGGKTWTNLSSKLPGLPAGSWIPYIQTGHSKPGAAWVVANNYRRNDWDPYLYYTSDYGTTWKRMADPKKVQGHCLSVWQDAVEPKLVFLGTEQGLWISTDEGNNWTRFNQNFPAVPVSDLKVHPREHDLVIATFGRAIWVLDDISPLRELISGRKKPQEQNITLFPVQQAVQAAWNQPEGIRFPANGFWEGANKSNGAQLSFYVKKTATDKEEKIKITGMVFNEQGAKIRTHRFTVDSSGFYRIHWRFVTDGIRFPSEGKVDKDADLPEGPRAAPGKYKLLLQYGTFKDSSWCTVLEDPRKPFRRNAYDSGITLYRRFAVITNRAYQAFEAIKSAEKSLSITREAMNFAPDSLKEQIQKEARKLQDSLQQFKALFMLPSDFRGYEDVTVRLNNLLYEAYGYIMNAEVYPGRNAIDAVRIAGAETDRICGRLNAFFEGPWVQFKKSVEQNRAPLFKDNQKF
ncbi:MAG: hypothetical protein KJS92_02615 [Bacteroidetes bacterium]|nr:hypothetical protein [Bacteroidota bacterium]